LMGSFSTPASKSAGDHSFARGPDPLGNGARLPTSVDQPVTVLARWFRLTDTWIEAIFPNLANFDASGHTLGLLTA